ncbi:MAG: 3'-5' exonuclease [Dysgonamonadaceae bacterium]|nr:3'-5' exonuclease [Dysgonamonadaceae bacterium]MDD4729293.1 3'-5' exonuclease [Dysgonamonadaceae bacterium]
MKSFAAIDFETANGYRSSICSVGIVIVKNGLITDKIYELIKPEPDYYHFVNTGIHGLTYEDTKDAPIFPKVWSLIDPKIKGLPLVAHNSPFDSGCLREVFKTYRLDYPDYEFHCTLSASRKQFKNIANHKLSTVAMHCGFNLTDHHHALADAEACAVIALQILS